MNDYNETLSRKPYNIAIRHIWKTATWWILIYAGIVITGAFLHLSGIGLVFITLLLSCILGYLALNLYIPIKRARDTQTWKNKAEATPNLSVKYGQLLQTEGSGGKQNIGMLSQITSISYGWVHHTFYVVRFYENEKALALVLMNGEQIDNLLQFAQTMQWEVALAQA